MALQRVQCDSDAFAHGAKLKQFEGMEEEAMCSRTRMFTS
jgi:hypothetical protein